jgi:hypothetical protein
MAIQSRFNDLIGALVAPHLRMSIDNDRQQTAKGKQPDQPHMFAADMGNEMQCVMEERTQQSALSTHNDTENAPSDKNDGIFSGMTEIRQP